MSSLQELEVPYTRDQSTRYPDNYQKRMKWVHQISIKYLKYLFSSYKNWTTRNFNVFSLDRYTYDIIEHSKVGYKLYPIPRGLLNMIGSKGSFTSIILPMWDDSISLCFVFPYKGMIHLCKANVDIHHFVNV